MREVFRDQLILVEFDESRALVYVRRTAAPIQHVEDASRAQREAISRIRGLGAKRLLLDMRAAVGRNDPEFENAMSAQIAGLLAMFQRSAVVVRTAIGRLQQARLQREHKLPYEVFLDEEQALAYLMALAS